MVMNRELKGDVMLIIEKRKKSATFFFYTLQFWDEIIFIVQLRNGHLAIKFNCLDISFATIYCWNHQTWSLSIINIFYLPQMTISLFFLPYQKHLKRFFEDFLCMLWKLKILSQCRKWNHQQWQPMIHGCRARKNPMEVKPPSLRPKKMSSILFPWTRYKWADSRCILQESVMAMIAMTSPTHTIWWKNRTVRGQGVWQLCLMLFLRLRRFSPFRD